MRAFVIRARSAPTHSQRFLSAVGTQAHTEILAHALMNAIFVAQSHRDDVLVYLVLESTRDFSRTVTFTSNELEHIGGFHEAALLNKIAKALEFSEGMTKEQVRNVEPGLSVRTISFEKLVQELAADYQLFVMNKKGTAIREQAFEGDCCFLLSDHIPMPKKTLQGLKRLGAKAISLGPKMLFASQCVVLIHNQLDLDQL